MVTKDTKKIRDGFAKLQTMTGDKAPSPLVQEVAEAKPVKKVGRKSHTLEGVEYERLGVKIPVSLKNEMIISMRTTHSEYKTMDVFVAEAIKVFLSLKQ
jgi:hypothetical protein